MPHVSTKRASDSRKWAFILVVMLVLVLAWAYSSSRGSGLSSEDDRPPQRVASFEGDPREEFGSLDPSQWRDAHYPFNRLLLAPPEEMITMLRVPPRVRKNTHGCSVLILRSLMNARHCDDIADHFTEELRATQTPYNSHYPSMWDTWNNSAQRKHILTYASQPRSLQTIRAKLKELSPPVIDTNPTLVRYLVKKCAKRSKKDTFQMAVIDTCAGWGGQAAGACAADVKCYHGYLPFDSVVRPALASRLTELLNT